MALAAGLVALAAGPVALAGSAAAAEPARGLVVKGSDTIGGELGPALAKGFEALHPGKHVAWEALGSKTAFVGLFDGSADLGAASRPINQDELKEAARLGIKLHEFIIAYDGLPVIVNPANHVPTLSIAQISDLFSGRIKSWREVGGADAPVTVVVRPPYSGTRAFFEEKALRRGNPKGPEQMSPAAVTLEHNHQVVAHVAHDAHAIGFVGLASLTREIRVVPLSPLPGAPGVLPEPERIRDGIYPLYRPLFLYTRGAPSGDAADMIRFVLSPAGHDIVRAIGFVPSEQTANLPAASAEGTAATGVGAASRPNGAASTGGAGGPAAGNATAGGTAAGGAGAGGPGADATAGAAAANGTRTAPVRVFFGTAGARLSAETRRALGQLAERIVREHHHLVVVGHADGRGALEGNERMSRARAEAVAAYLRSLNVSADLIKVEAAGANAPIATNDTKSGREKNRRADIFVLP